MSATSGVRTVSSSRAALWSSVSGIATPERHSTARESPAGNLGKLATPMPTSIPHMSDLFELASQELRQLTKITYSVRSQGAAHCDSRHIQVIKKPRQKTKLNAPQLPTYSWRSPTRATTAVVPTCRGRQYETGVRRGRDAWNSISCNQLILSPVFSRRKQANRPYLRRISGLGELLVHPHKGVGESRLEGCGREGRAAAGARPAALIDALHI